MCENRRKSMQIPFFIFLYVDRELRIPEAAFFYPLPRNLTIPADAMNS